MRVLLAGLTGQLGRGLVEATTGIEVELIPVVRPAGTRQPAERIRRSFPAAAGIGDVIPGEVSASCWGLDLPQWRRLAPTVHTVINLAAETNWASPLRRLHAVNVLGALNGFELTRQLQRESGERKTYIYASTIHAAGDRTGWIPERPLPAADRTAYEHTKWLAEHLLLERAAEPDAPALIIARIGGLLGSQANGETSRRNSLYVLADRWERLKVFPIRPNARVDFLPRDVAGRLVLTLAEAAERTPADGPEIVHVCAGEQAPTMAAVLATLRAIDVDERVPPIRTLAVPEPLLGSVSRQLERVQRLRPSAHNALIAMRYLSFDRLFERDRLHARLAQPPLAVPIEEIVRLAFDLPRIEPAIPSADGAFARFLQ